MTVVALAGAAARRIVRDRTSLFFLIILPILVIVVIGSTVRGFGELRVAVVAPAGDELAAGLVDQVGTSPAIDLRRYDGLDGARTALRRSEVDAVLSLPPRFTEALLSTAPADVTIYAEQTSGSARSARSAIAAEVEVFVGRVQAARFASDAAGSFDAAMTAAARVERSLPRLSVNTVAVDVSADFLPEGFSYSAPTMLVLFVFITSLAGGASMIQARNLGIYDRMLAGPVRPRAVIAGEAATYAAIAIVQSVLVVGVGALLFDVRWGDPFAVAALVVTWALVGTAAGMLSGTLFRTVEQASSIGPIVGMAFGMLGGTMWPLEIVPSIMRTIGHVVPHGWAVDAWIEVMSRGGGIVDVLPNLVVLAGFGLALGGIATFRLRSRLAA